MSKIGNTYDDGVKEVQRGTALMLLSGGLAFLGTFLGAAFIESGTSKKAEAQAYTDVLSGATTFENYAVVKLNPGDENDD